MKPYYQDQLVTLYHGDCRELSWPIASTIVLDPPWDQLQLLDDLPLSARNLLVFTDGRRMGEAVSRFGPPTWLFTWDTMNTWQTGHHRPVQQTKHCLWYGKLEEYERDAALWGEAPPARDHPTTKQVPLSGRRLTDLWRESLRWLHNPTAGAASIGSERFGKVNQSPWRHAKPVGWLRCLLGNCAGEGDVLDPFAGTGPALLAAKSLGRKATGMELDERCCEIIAERLSQGFLDLGIA